MKIKKVLERVDEVIVYGVFDDYDLIGTFKRTKDGVIYGYHFLATSLFDIQWMLRTIEEHNKDL